ncbi:MAG: hypothetical protein BWY66_01363 [bacterium ADurb.Bin374]|nr:MAG: hypothetical protein BWY66_01363 [bacterium ADurb.Bin374]
MQRTHELSPHKFTPMPGVHIDIQGKPNLGLNPAGCTIQTKNGPVLSSAAQGPLRRLPLMLSVIFYEN